MKINWTILKNGISAINKNEPNNKKVVYQ